MDNSILIQPKIQGDSVTIEIPRKILEGLLALSRQKKQTTARTYLKQYKGLLKNRITIDPLKYERKIRAEWDRDLDL